MCDLRVALARLSVELGDVGAAVGNHYGVAAGLAGGVPPVGDKAPTDAVGGGFGDEYAGDVRDAILWPGGKDAWNNTELTGTAARIRRLLAHALLKASAL